jgi:hypothetical protein
MNRDFTIVGKSELPITEEEAKNAVDLPSPDDVRKFFN